MGTLSRLIDRLLRHRPPRIDVHVRVHRAMLSDPYAGEAYFVNVLNTSPQQSITVTHVLFDAAGTQISVLTRPLPATVLPGEQWETWISPSELPPGSIDVEHSFRVVLADDSVVASAPRENAPPADSVPD